MSRTGLSWAESTERCEMYRIAGITWNIASIRVKCRTALKNEFELVICLRRYHFSFLISYLCWAHVERFFGSTARSIFRAICKSRTSIQFAYWSLASLFCWHQSPSRSIWVLIHTHWNHLVRAFSLVMWTSNCFTIVLHYLLGHTIYDLAFVYNTYSMYCSGMRWMWNECKYDA